MNLNETYSFQQQFDDKTAISNSYHKYQNNEGCLCSVEFIVMCKLPKRNQGIIRSGTILC